MDEVLFRSSQKLDNLQVQLNLAASEGKSILQQYSQQTKTLFSQALESPKYSQFKENLQDLWFFCVTLISELKDNAERFPKTVYDSFIKTLGKQWTKQNVCFGCIGFILGGIVGVGIGMALRRHEPARRYMQAVQCLSYMGVESATVVEDAVAPTFCTKDEILVNVKAGSLHILDAQICSGYGRRIRKLLSKYFKYSCCELPVTLGRDCTGIVVDVGPEVVRLEVGDEIWLTVPFWAPGTLSQTFVVSECKAARKPKNIGYEGAASLPHAGSVALASLEEANIDADNAKEKKILVHNGCTPVGCVLIQVLKLWGAETTTTCYKRAIPVAKALGANQIITIPEGNPAENGDLEKQLELYSGFDVIFSTKDCPAITQNQLRGFCCENGSFISTLPPVLASDSFGLFMGPIFAAYVRIKCFLQRVLSNEIGNFGETHVCYAILEQLSRMVENGELQTVVDKVYHPQDIELALRHIMSSESIGSTVITFR